MLKGRTLLNKIGNERALQIFTFRAKSLTSTGINNNQDEHHDWKNRKNYSKTFKWISLGAAATLMYLNEKWKMKAYLLEGNSTSAVNDPGKFIEGMPVFTSDDVAKHQDADAGIWISYKNGVYDITNFVKRHPGGSKILLAAGGSVEPFWSLYAVHKQPEILAMMEEYRIGNLAKGEELLAVANMEDPYASEPRRHPVLNVRSMKPFNAEPPPALLVENYITPTDIFYVRNHLPVPELVDNYSVEVAIGAGNSTSTTSLNLEELKIKYPQYVVTASLQCAGNRRSEMNQVKPVKGLAWTQGAMANATWRGPRLRDVLLSVGFKENEDYENMHVQFEGLDTDPTSMPYGASIPLAKAMDPRGDVILAYEMNGEPLTRDHGYPLRVVVPGTTGARWVKWLTKIEVSNDESDSHWQKNDYKSFSPSTDWDKVDFSKAPAIQEMPITSVVCDPQNGETVALDQDGRIKLRGYAWSGGGRAITRVDVSLDRGITWHVATLIDPVTSKGPNRQWAWTRWQAAIPVQNNGQGVDVWVRAVDSSYNTQPENMDHIWNLRGLMAVAYHKIKVSIS